MLESKDDWYENRLKYAEAEGFMVGWIIGNLMSVQKTCRRISRYYPENLDKISNILYENNFMRNDVSEFMEKYPKLSMRKLAKMICRESEYAYVSKLWPD